MDSEKLPVTIRPYVPADRAAVRKIAFTTAFLERPAEFFDDEEILSDILTLYFTDYEPQSSFVAEAAGGEVIGYLIGAQDTRTMDRVSLGKVGPLILGRSLKRGLLGRGKIVRFLGQLFVSFCRGEFFSRDFSREYPATFHINIRAEARGQRVGERLVTAFLEYLRARQIPGVRVSTFSEGACQFFLKVGLVLLERKSRTFLRYRTGKDVTAHFLGKRLGV